MSSRVHARLLSLLLVVVASACRGAADHVESGGASRARGGLRVPAVPYDVEHYSIQIDLDPSQRAIQARCTLRVWPTEEKLERVELDFEGLDVRGIHDREGRALSWKRAEGRLCVDLFAPIARGEYAEFTVEYSGRPERGLWFTRERNGVATEVFTHGECHDARAWFPCRDQPDERATSEVQVSMPRAWTSIASGERIERVESGERAIERWRMTFPHPAYIETLVAGEFQVENDEWDGVPLVFAGPVEFKENLRTAFAETGEILAYFSRVTGARYPYSKYAQVCVDNFPYGGMENVSATTMTDTMLPDEQGLADHDSRELVAHEAAHQWFGDLLTCKDWSHAWLNEGFATYFAALYGESSRGVDAFRREMRNIRDSYLSRDAGPNRRPIVHGAAGDPLDLFFTGHVYEGAAIRLHHLRAMLGDDVFFRGIQRYVETNRGRGVVTDDLRIALEQVSGRDLRGFFEQWFYAPGFPVVESSWNYDEANHVVRLDLEQTQEPVNGTPAVFTLPLDVEVHSQGGSRIERVEFDARRQRFEIACTRAPVWVLVDPLDTVPMRLNERMKVSQWFDVVDEADANARVRALGVVARALPNSMDGRVTRQMLDCLALHAREDTCAEARLISTRGLANAKRAGTSVAKAAGLETAGADRVAPGIEGLSYRAFLFESASNDQDLEVRIAALEALRALGPDAATARYAEDELKRADGWRLRGALASLRARAAPEAAFDFLVRELETRSAHGTYEGRILAELNATKDPRVPLILVAWVRDATKPDGARAIGVRELARAPMDDDARSAVIALLDSSRVRLRREALSALSSSSHPSARAALERHARETRIPSERRAAENALARTASDA